MAQLTGVRPGVDLSWTALVYTKVRSKLGLLWAGVAGAYNARIGAGRCPVLVTLQSGRRHCVRKGKVIAGAFNGGGGWSLQWRIGAGRCSILVTQHHMGGNWCIKR